MGFGDSVRNTANKMQRQVNAHIVKVASELFTGIVATTPVGTSDTKGQLINNWNLGVGIGLYNVSTTKSFNTSGMRSYGEIAKLRSSVEFLGKDGEVSFTNAVSYAFRAEYAGWPAPQWSGSIGPYAMVRKSLLVVATKYRNP